VLVDTLRTDPVRRRADRRLLVLAALAVVAVAAYLLIDVRGSWAFALRLRGWTILTILLVGYAVAVSTVLFQTVATNRILTPSIMGFDALYALIQTALVAALGAASLTRVPTPAQFALEVGLMVGFSLLLFRRLFGAHARDLHLLVLVGIVLGVMFRSLSSFVQRLLDPNEFSVLQNRLFATFSGVDHTLLTVSALTVAGATVALWRLRATFDVLALGRDMAVSLGVDHRRAVLRVLVVVAVLVSVSTALVGPITFFGLLVANLAYRVVGTDRHRATLPAAVLLAVVCLAGGQAVLQHGLELDTTLAVVIEFVGGLVFLVMLVRRVRR
jgi:iron complex transport system permease protein